MFEDEDFPGYWDTLILLNQDNYKLIKRFKLLMLAIFDQKRVKNGLEYPTFPYFSYGSCKQTYQDSLVGLPAKQFSFVPVNINI